MQRTIIAALCLLSVAVTTTLRAQAAAPRPPGPPAPPPTGSGEVRGSVVETDGRTPVARASVAIHDQDGAVAAGAIADARGAFRIPGLRAGTYRMRIRMLGYAPHAQELTITDAAPRVALRPVPLTRVAVTLAGVSTVAERDAMVIEPDRTSYRTKDVAPAAQSASDVLENVPAVQVDSDGKVSLRGNENVVVQINGRPTPIRGPQLASYLKSLPGTIVERIEVVPNPSAKYDAEGMAGIINVVLKQQVDLGLSGGATVSAANTDRYSASTNLGYQAGAWTSSLTLGHTADERGVLGVNDQERLRAGDRLGFTDQDVAGRNGFSGTNLNGTLEYRLNPRDVLLSSLALGRRRGLDASTAANIELDAARTFLDAYDRTRDMRTIGRLVDVTGGFRRSWNAAQKHELSSELRYTRNDDDEHAVLWRVPPTAGSVARSEGEINQTDARQQQLVAQLDYTKPLANRRRLDAGYKGTARWLDRDFRARLDALGNGDWQLSDGSNAFGFDEQVQALYGMYSHPVGTLDVQGGLRGEYARRDVSLATGRSPYNYLNFFPSGALVYTRSAALQYKASYSRRIRRPGTQELNPLPQFFDAQNVFFGNPQLAPEYTDAYEVGVTRTGKLGTLQLAPYFRRTTDIIQVDIDTDDRVNGRTVTSLSFRNAGTSNSWGSDLNGSLRLGSRLNAFGGVNVFKMVTDGGSTSSLAANTVSWMARLNASSQLTRTTTLQGSYVYRAPLRVPAGQFSSTSMVNVSVRQQVRGERSSVTLRVMDPFNTQRLQIRAGDDNLIQFSSRQFGLRAVFVAYQYTFGRPPRTRVRPDEPTPPPAAPGFP